MNDSQPQSTNAPERKGVPAALVVVGILFLISLPFVPWLARGLNQQSAENAVIAVGGRASYGKYLLEEADYFRDGKQQGKSFIRDLFGDAYVEELTLVELRKEVPKSVLTQVSQLPHLEILDASGANFDDADVAIFSDCVSLKKLWINGSRATAGSVETIAELPNLMSLNLDDMSVDDDALTSIGKHPELKRLYLARTQVTDAGVAKLTGLGKLLGIGLEGTEVTDGSTEHLAKLQTLKELRLGDSAITDAGASRLSKLTNLQSLNLEDTKLTTAGLSWLADCEQLEIVDLSGTDVTDVIINVLAAMPKLVSVSLRNTAVSPAAIEELKRALGPTATVQSDLGDVLLAR